jgi:hypothetical protein
MDIETHEEENVGSWTEWGSLFGAPIARPCEFSRLLVYDGDPRKSGTLIADEVVRSGDP